MGDVYLAEHVVLGKRMAVKVLKAEFSRDEEFVQRFQQEAVAASRIGHENIVSVTDFGRTSEGAFYFVMEALSGTDLATLLRTEGIPPLGRTLPILLHVSRALGAAHAQGIVHRDLKAENVMVIPRDDGSDLVKVLDFGVSKMAAASENPRVTRQGLVLGTPNYMAPEQARGEGVDARSDIYSFGVLAYELFTGTVPFVSTNATGVLLKHLTEAPQPPTARRPDLALPSDLEHLVLAMLEKDPAQRPQTMAEVREVLMRAAQPGSSASTLWRSNGPVPLLLTAPAPLDPGAGDPLDPVLSRAVAPGLDRTWVSSKLSAPRRWSPLTLLGGAVIALLAVGGATLLLSRRAAPSPVPVAPATSLAPALSRVPPPTPTPVARTPPTVAPPPVEMVSAHAPAAPHRLSVKDVERVFGRSSAKLRKCLQDNRKTLPGRAGSIAVSFLVVRSGAVKNAKVTTPGEGSGPLAHCVTARVEEMKFPAHAENAVAFEIPLAYDFKD